MNEYIILMHGEAEVDAAWGDYIAGLRRTGRFDGGSSIGAGVRLKKGEAPTPAPASPTGFIRVRAADLDEALLLLQGNPAYEAGGTIEIRELPKDD